MEPIALSGLVKSAGAYYVIGLLAHCTRICFFLFVLFVDHFPSMFSLIIICFYCIFIDVDLAWIRLQIINVAQPLIRCWSHFGSSKQGIQL